MGQREGLPCSPSRGKQDRSPAGGRGTRLGPLTAHRAKPALPFGGKYRIIDFTLSNCVNSGVRKVGVCTQYRARSLIRHLHRRPEVFASLARAVRPGGRLYLVEPHHNVRRVARLFWKWCTRYRRPAFWRQERHWATHDFLTTREIRRLCADAGFERVAVSGYWIPFTRRFVADPRRRFALETRLGRLPGVRHMAAVLAVEARRR